MSTDARVTQRRPRRRSDGVVVAEAIAEALAAAGTTVLFGVPGGGANLDLVGAAERAGIRFVLTHGETAGAIMAATYGELTGRPGACLATRGPGAASIVNGVAQAQLDRAPLLVVTDAVGSHSARRVSRQRIDHAAMLRPVTKHTLRIGAAGASALAAAAVRETTANRPGAVHLDVLPEETSSPVPERRAEPLTGDVASARALLASSRRPVFLAGIGARATPRTLRDLVERTPWRVLTTYKAKGVVPESWPNSAGLFTGGRIEAPALADADLIVGVGLDPVELIPAPWPYSAPVLSLTSWPHDASYYEPAVELIGPMAASLELVRAALPRTTGASDGVRFREEALASLAARTGGLGPGDVVLAARRVAPPGTIATADAGAHMLLVMPYWLVDGPGEALISSGHATMGFALPAAIAASLAQPQQHVICFVGDGGLGMTLAELETLARLSLPVTVVVFNDSSLSLIEIKRDPEMHGAVGAVRYADTDFATIAKGFGVEPFRVDDESSLESVFSDAFSTCSPTLVDVRVDASDYGRVMRAIRGGASGG